MFGTPGTGPAHVSGHSGRAGRARAFAPQEEPAARIAPREEAVTDFITDGEVRRARLSDPLTRALAIGHPRHRCLDCVCGVVWYASVLWVSGMSEGAYQSRNE